MKAQMQYWTPVAALLLLFSGHANSATCGEMSPRLLELGDDYYEPITAPQAPFNPDRVKPQVSKLEHILGGSFRSGSGFRVTCFGTGDRARPVTSHFDLDEIEPRNLLNGEQLLTAIEDVHSVLADADDRMGRTGSIRSIKLSLPPVEFWTVNASGQGLSTVTAHWRRNASQFNDTRNTSMFLERVWTAVPSDNGVTLEVHDYMNGVHGGSMLWRLRSS